MSDEIRISSGIQVKKGVLDYRSSNPTSFLTDMTTARGPSPGTIVASTGGTDIDFSELINPGWCRITNLSETVGNFVDVGIYDGDHFYPLMEIAPGEVAGPFKLSRRFDEGGSGSGTSTLTSVRIKAAVENCAVNVEAFDS